jgi:hypothetical protein
MAELCVVMVGNWALLYKSVSCAKLPLKRILDWAPLQIRESMAELCVVMVGKWALLYKSVSWAKLCLKRISLDQRKHG